ncbi:MAG: stimulus-sensing domain-containing protein [Rhodospirillales bacterium]
MNDSAASDQQAYRPSADPRGAARKRRRRGNKRLSPITRRILAINVLALGILVAGLLYLGEYRDNLIRSAMDGLAIEAEMFAAAIGEGAVTGESPVTQDIIRETANRIVVRMVESTETRARLFRLTGELVADSRRLLHAGREVEIRKLPPPDEGPDFWEEVFAFYDELIDAAIGTKQPAPYVEQPRQFAQHYPEVMAAFEGRTSRAIRSAGQDGLVFTVAVPVQRYKQVVGALLVSKTSAGVDEALLEVRLDILRLFMVSLAITVLLSIYLAGTIARPVRLLALAADRVRGNLNRRNRLPDFGGRDDEIGELAAALTEMTDALWTRMDAIERFAADVSHEIKNPLTSLKSAVETAARLKDPDQQRRLMAIIQDDVERLDRLITDISNASRLDSELSKGEITELNVREMLALLVEMHNDTRGPDEPVFSLNASTSGALGIVGMEDRLMQVFRNLIGNAVSFSPPGGHVDIDIHREPASPVGDAVCVQISDEGPGIPAGREEAIFERFYSERPEGEKFGTHSGLGLSISRQIVQAHGGSLTARNRMDDSGKVIGARFTAYLPVATKARLARLGQLDTTD